MATTNTLLLRSMKPHNYLPLVDKDDPRVLHYSNASYFRHANGQIVFPEAPLNGRAKKLQKKKLAKMTRTLNGQLAIQS